VSLAKNAQRSVRLNPAEDKVFKDACDAAGLEPADAMRAALMEWTQNRKDNVRLKALEESNNLLVHAIVALTERFDACVQINLPGDDPTAKMVRDAVSAKAEEPEPVGAGA